MKKTSTILAIIGVVCFAAAMFFMKRETAAEIINSLEGEPIEEEEEEEEETETKPKNYGRPTIQKEEAPGSEPGTETETGK